jgi:hypothetical protein
MCIKALEQLSGREKYVPLKDIVSAVRELWPRENVNEGTIRDQIFRHCINCHPTHDEFPDRGKMWRQRRLFITDGKGNYRFYDEKRDKHVYIMAIQQHEERGNEMAPRPQKKEDVESKRTLSLTDIYNEIADKLQRIGTKLGFKAENSVRIEGGEIDHVWFIDFGKALPYFGSKIPITGFEIETSWRTRKHIKGDIFNLISLNSAYGVVLFLKQGFRNESQFRGNTEAAKRYAESLYGRGKIFVWSEEDVNTILTQL